MSYCRFSDDLDASDLYVYESDMGFCAHVAGQRRVPAEPLPPLVPFGMTQFDAWMARHIQVAAILEAAPQVPIGLPHDGQSFYFEEPGEMADQLEKLAALGYHVPQHAIDALRNEQVMCEFAEESAPIQQPGAHDR